MKLGFQFKVSQRTRLVLKVCTLVACGSVEFRLLFDSSKVFGEILQVVDVYIKFTLRILERLLMKCFGI